jgi:hypothetical protein
VLHGIIMKLLRAGGIIAAMERRRPTSSSAEARHFCASFVAASIWTFMIRQLAIAIVLFAPLSTATADLAWSRAGHFDHKFA